jgi:pSer/pThr/pTyr-binding forkhead associated (FHA) protein
MGTVSVRPFLQFRGADDSQRVFFFEPGSQSASVGRQASSDVALDWDDQVSRVHARFERAGDDWDLVDDGLSRNGTFVNGERISGRRRLNDGDSLRFGTTTVTFRAPARTPAAPAGTPAVGLSTTQRRVLVALCRPYKDRSGFASPATDEQIAEELFLSVGEVRAHLKVIGVKLGVDGARVHLVERAFSAGLISEDDL